MVTVSPVLPIVTEFVYIFVVTPTSPDKAIPSFEVTYILESTLSSTGTHTHSFPLLSFITSPLSTELCAGLLFPFPHVAFPAFIGVYPLGIIGLFVFGVPPFIVPFPVASVFKSTFIVCHVFTLNITLSENVGFVIVSPVFPLAE